ncbi:MAG: electron transfer flavoprotein beta subunit/FixA family protein [Bacteroidetes bacterium]|nr:MAG: electron transfer flavoprotein beta subunit/FixA family protein [Bacteroidota bacterium]
MKILVCITHVPDTVSKISFTDNNTKFNTQNIQFIIGPYDDYALARAVELRDSIAGSTLTVLNIGTADTEPTIRKALAIGADDAIRIDAEPLDSVFVATQIAEIAKKKSYDLILMGRESIDFNGNVVHGLVAEMLNIPVVSPVMKLDIVGNKATMTKEIEGGKEIVELNLPFVAGCQEPIAEWKIPNMRGIMSAKTKPYEVLPAFGAEMGASTMQFDLPAAKSGCKMIDAATPEKLFELLKSEAKVL